MTAPSETPRSAFRQFVSLRAICIAAGLGLAAASLLGVSPVAAATLVIKNVTIVDTHTGKLHPNSTVFVTGGKITKITAAGAAGATGSAKVVDGKGKYLIPGLNDMHAHPLGHDGWRNDMALFIANGVTGVRQMNGSDEMLAARKAGMSFKNQPVHPEIFGIPSEVLSRFNAPTPEEGIAQVDKFAAEGADFIKVVDGTPASFFAIGKEAKKHGLDFEGHLPVGVDAAEASNAGYRSMEHMGPGQAMLISCSTDGPAILKDSITVQPRMPSTAEARTKSMAELTLEADPHYFTRLQHEVDTYSEAKCRDLAKVFVKNGTWMVPTLIEVQRASEPDEPKFMNDPTLPYIPVELRPRYLTMGPSYAKGLTAEQRATMHHFFDLQLKVAKLFYDTGVQMLAGTDSPICTWGFCLHQEFELLEGIGIPPLQVLQMTTLDAAKFYHRTDMGSVEVGKNANLVLLTDNPIKTSKNLKKIDAVIRDGTYYSRSDLDTLLSEAAKSAAVAPAPTNNGPTGSGTGPMPTVDDSIGVLAADPRTRPLLDKYFPGLTSFPAFENIKGMKLKNGQAVQPQMFSDEKIAALAAALAAAKP